MMEDKLLGGKNNEPKNNKGCNVKRFISYQSR